MISEGALSLEVRVEAGRVAAVQVASSRRTDLSRWQGPVQSEVTLGWEF